MSQIKETSGGLRVLDIPLFGATNEEGRLLTTSDHLVELENLYYTYKGNKDFNTYINMYVSLGKVLRSCSTPKNLLELQVTNPYLTQSGWNLLIMIFRLGYLLSQAGTHKDTAINEAAMLVKSSMNIPTTRMTGDNLEISVNTRDLRNNALESLVNVIGKEGIIFNNDFYINLYSCPEILTRFVALFIVNDREY